MDRLDKPHEVTRAKAYPRGMAIRPRPCSRCGAPIATGDPVAYSLRPPRQRLDVACEACFPALGVEPRKPEKEKPGGKP
jgi:hypothetical protein